MTDADREECMRLICLAYDRLDRAFDTNPDQRRRHEEKALFFLRQGEDLISPCTSDTPLVQTA